MYSDECDCTKARICSRSMGKERDAGKTAGNSSTEGGNQQGAVVHTMLKYDE